MVERDPNAKSEDWRRYYERTGERPPRETLIRALEAFEAEAADAWFAVDLGCGGGRDVVELLRRGWQVRAVDAERSAIDKLTARGDLPPTGRLETEVARFEDVILPACDLVNSSFALPLCPRESFLALWARIVTALRPGGRFSGQFYGDRDEWAGDPTITHLTRADVDGLLAGLEIEYFSEEETDSVTPRGTPKHWHVYHLVVRKPAPA